MQIQNDLELISKIKEGDQIVINEIYTKYRNEFISYLMANNDIDEDNAKECFQLAMMILYENIIQGKLITLTSSLKTYLFQIGINKSKEIFRKYTKISYGVSDFMLNMEDSQAINEQEKIEKESQLEKLSNAMEKLGEHCKEILISFYYKNMNNTLIAEKMKYKNEDTVKNLKYKCIQQLKKYLN